MSRFARILAFVVLAAFAAGTAAHTAAATDMTLKMSMAAMDDHGMADCQDCPDDDGQAMDCDPFCVTVQVALPAPAAAALQPHAQEVATLPAAAHGGITGPPERHPPRTIHIG